MSDLVKQLENAARLAPDYLPFCPNCSLRTKPYQGGPSFVRARHSGGFTLIACCSLAKGAPVITGEEKTARQSLANWWKMQRLTGKPEMLAWFREHCGITEEMEATK